MKLHVDLAKSKQTYPTDLFKELSQIYLGLIGILNPSDRYLGIVSLLCYHRLYVWDAIICESVYAYQKNRLTLLNLRLDQKNQQLGIRDYANLGQSAHSQSLI